MPPGAPDKSTEDRVLAGLSYSIVLLLISYNLTWAYAPRYASLSLYPLVALSSFTLFYVGLIWNGPSLSNDTRRLSRLIVGGAWFLTALVVIGALVRPTPRGFLAPLGMALLDILFPLGLSAGRSRPRS